MGWETERAKDSVKEKGWGLVTDSVKEMARVMVMGWGLAVVAEVAALVACIAGMSSSVRQSRYKSKSAAGCRSSLSSLDRPGTYPQHCS